MNCIFGMQKNIEIFDKLIHSFWVCVTRHAQSTQKKFAYPAISPEKHGDEVDFLPADKHKSSPQTDTDFDEDGQAFPNFPKYQVCSVFTISQRGS